jgi:hypothetical protein
MKTVNAGVKTVLAFSIPSRILTEPIRWSFHNPAAHLARVKLLNKCIANALTDTGLVPICRQVFSDPLRGAFLIANS